MKLAPIDNLPNQIINYKSTLLTNNHNEYMKTSEIHSLNLQFNILSSYNIISQQYKHINIRSSGIPLKYFPLKKILSYSFETPIYFINIQKFFAINQCQLKLSNHHNQQLYHILNNTNQNTKPTFLLLKHIIKSIIKSVILFQHQQLYHILNSTNQNTKPRFLLPKYKIKLLNILFNPCLLFQYPQFYHISHDTEQITKHFLFLQHILKRTFIIFKLHLQIDQVISKHIVKWFPTNININIFY